MSETEFYHSDSNSVENNEHYVFVKLLANYKVLLGTEKFPNVHEKKAEAASALCKEYNQICTPLLTRRKVLKKVCNMKARLKEKNFKNLSRTKKLGYTDWERMFLDLWVGSGITVLANKLDKSAEVITPTPVKKPRIDESNRSVNVINQPEYCTPDDITIKIEKDDDFLQNADNSPISTISSTNHGGDYSEYTTRFENKEDEEDKYESMTLDELKHVALVAQIKLLNEQKAAARSKKELNQYKLLLLKRENRNE